MTLSWFSLFRDWGCLWIHMRNVLRELSVRGPGRSICPRRTPHNLSSNRKIMLFDFPSLNDLFINLLIRFCLYTNCPADSNQKWIGYFVWLKRIIIKIIQSTFFKFIFWRNFFTSNKVYFVWTIFKVRHDVRSPKNKHLSNRYATQSVPVELMFHS